MHARIESIVRDQLARSPSATIETRQQVYDNIRSLLPAVVDTPEAGVDRLRLALALDEVIARIEVEHGSAPRSRMEPARLSEQEQIAFGSQRDTHASNYLYARERSAALRSAIGTLP